MIRIFEIMIIALRLLILRRVPARFSEQFYPTVVESAPGSGLTVDEFDFSCCGDIEQAVGFAWISSGWYPQLSDWYEKKGDEWCARKEREQAEEMDAEELEEVFRRDERETAGA